MDLISLVSIFTDAVPPGPMQRSGGACVELAQQQLKHTHAAQVRVLQEEQKQQQLELLQVPTHTHSQSRRRGVCVCVCGRRDVCVW